MFYTETFYKGYWTFDMIKNQLSKIVILTANKCNGTSQIQNNLGDKLELGK